MCVLLPSFLPACLPAHPLIHQGALDNINLFQVITIMAFFMLLPVSILFEGLPCLPYKMAAAVSDCAGACDTVLVGHKAGRQRVGLTPQTSSVATCF